MRTDTVDDVRHISFVCSDNTDMLGTFTKVNIVAVNVDRVVELVINAVAPGHLHQLSLVMAEGDPIPPTVGLGEEEEISKV